MRGPGLGIRSSWRSYAPSALAIDSKRKIAATINEKIPPTITVALKIELESTLTWLNANCFPRLPPIVIPPFYRYNCFGNVRLRIRALRLRLLSFTLTLAQRRAILAELNWMLRNCPRRHYCKCPANERLRLLRMRQIIALLIGLGTVTSPYRLCLEAELKFLRCCYRRPIISDPILVGIEVRARPIISINLDCRPYVALQWHGLVNIWDGGNNQCNGHTNNRCPFFP